MPSTYLHLSNLQKSVANNTITWNNLPTLSSSTRECYISILDMDIVFNAAIGKDEVLVKINLPTNNYFSSNNDAPVMRYLITSDKKVFAPNLQGSLEVLSNDNLKRVEVQLFDSSGAIITDALTSINITLEMDYVDQKAVTETYLEEIPKHLGGK